MSRDKGSRKPVGLQLTAAQGATLGQLLETRGQDHLNNFTLLRLAAALLVVYGHSFALAAPCANCFDVTTRYLRYMYSGDLGLHIFFVVSGFLVTFSMERSGDIRQFLYSRALRIYPGLIVFVLLGVGVVGPIFTSVSLEEYFGSQDLRAFVRTNATASGYYPYLPGLFADSRFPNTMAGTLWTLWVEVRLYLLVALFGALGLLGKRGVAIAAILALTVFCIAFPTYAPLLNGDPHNVRLAAFFAAGALLYLLRHQVPMRMDVLLLLVLFAWLSRHRPEYDLYFGAVIIYGSLLFAFSRKLTLPRGLDDYSFGIYLYGWTIQQVLFELMPGIGPYRMALLSIPLSIIAGALSWHLVEKRALQLRKRLGKRRNTAAVEIASPSTTMPVP